MRIRSIKPEFWRSKTIAQLPWDVRLVLKGLESYVDDNGVGKDDIALIAADVFPRDLSGNPRDTLARLSEAISALESAGLVVRYEYEGEDLLYIDRWKEWQRIDKAAKGRFPRPDGTFEYAEEVNRDTYANPREGFEKGRGNLAPVTGEQGNRGTGEQGNRNSSAPAALDIPAEEQTDLFDEFWHAWPRSEGKAEARKAWTKATRQTPPQLIVDRARAYAEHPHRPERQFVPHGATWLNQQRYLDPLPEAPEHRRTKPTAFERGAALVAEIEAEASATRLQVTS